MREQDLVLDKVTALGEAKGWTVVNNGEYANTGVLRLLDDNLDPAYTLRYSFQSTYYSLKLMVGKGYRNYTAERAKAEGKLIFDASTIGHYTTSQIIDMFKEGIRFNK